MKAPLPAGNEGGGAAARTRLVCLAGMALLAPLGIATKFLPGAFVKDSLGDVLIVIFLALGARLVLPGARRRTILLLVGAYAFGIELSQLYSAPLIDAWRATWPGRIFLGTTFQHSDFLMYLAGLGIFALIDHRWRLRAAPGE